MRGSDLTMEWIGEIGRGVPAHIARVPQCARIAIRHPDPQKHKVFQYFQNLVQQYRSWASPPSNFLSNSIVFPQTWLVMRGSDLTLEWIGDLAARAPPQVARVAQCARIAIRHPDPQKHMVFQHFSKSRSTVSQLSMVTFQNYQY